MPRIIPWFDYVGIVGADLTEGRTGIQIGSIPFGLRIGLREGIVSWSVPAADMASDRREPR
jgi:hypothetical protein